MRKFFAVIFAVILAFLVATAALLYREGIPFGEMNIQKGKEVWAALLAADKEKTDKKPNLPLFQQDVPASAPEENLSYDQRIEKGDYYFDRGFLTFASNEYVKAANLEPDRVDPYLKLLKTNYELGDYKKAQRNAEIVLKMLPTHFQTRFSLAEIYIRQSDFESALGLMEQLTDPENPDPQVLYYRGLLAILFNDNEAGKKFLKEAKVKNQDTSLDRKIDYFLSAYTEYEFAKSAEELYLSELLARAYNKAEEYEMAIYKLKNILRMRNDLRDAWILFGFAYLNLESYNFARTAFEKAYELDSEWPSTQYFLGITHAELGNADDAIVYLNYALVNNFEPKLILYQRLADLYLEAKDYTKSVESYEKVLELNSSDINSFVRPVWIYLDFLKKPAKALAVAQIAAENFPDNAMSYNLLGWSLIGTGDHVKAEENLKKAIQMDPNLAAAYYNLGNLYVKQNKNQLALEVYQKAYELDQNGSIGNLAAKAYNELMTQ